MITVIVSVLYGTPEKLPGVALGLPLLLDLERSAAVLATIALVLIFAFLTSRGHLPTQFGNFAYPSIERQHDLEERVAALDRRLKQRLIPLEDGKRTSDEVLPLILKDLSEMSDRLEAVEARRGV
ncbi:MAG TPA: hypothetical protein VGX16_00900 [Solirubrobacteraceae bacterium]|nr:hypothetical protein [Solirubrobacteraceae bacterium]